MEAIISSISSQKSHDLKILLNDQVFFPSFLRRRVRSEAFPGVFSGRPDSAEKLHIVPGYPLRCVRNGSNLERLALKKLDHRVKQTPFNTHLSIRRLPAAFQCIFVVVSSFLPAYLAERIVEFVVILNFAATTI
jgi:hypothetical protein